VSAQTADRRPPTAEGEARAAVVAEARSWLGTPYHHAADVKSAGVDCAMLLVRVYCDLGLVEPFDPRPYTRDWFLHRSEERYLGFLLAHSHEVRALCEGDIVLFASAAATAMAASSPGLSHSPSSTPSPPRAASSRT
jgi:cell wall-associated NlpC family hydrolase